MVRAASDRKLTIVEIFRGVELDAGLECFSALFEDFLHLRRNPLLRFFLGFVSFEFEMPVRIGFNQGFIQQPSQGLCGPIRVLTIFVLAAGAARNFACGYPLAGKGFQVGADFSFFAVHARRSVLSIQGSMSSLNACDEWQGAHLDTTTIRTAEATERPTPDRAAAPTKRLLPPDQESGAPVVVSKCTQRQAPVRDQTAHGRLFGPIIHL